MNHSIPQQILDIIERSSPFDQLSEELQASVCRHLKVIYLTRDNAAELLEELAPSLYLIVSGEYTVTDSMMSEQDATRHLSQGDYFGYSALLDGETHQLQIDTENPGVIYAISRSIFDECCRQSEVFIDFFRRLHNRELHRRNNAQSSSSESMWLHQSLSNFCLKPPIGIDADSSIQAAAQKMTEHKISALAIQHEQQLIGLITDRDLRHRVIAKGTNPQQPVRKIMTHPALSISNRASVFDAMMLMSAHNIHHLPIVDQKQTPVGFVSANDLIRQQQSSLVYLAGAIRKATKLEQLIELAKQAPEYLHRHAHRLGDYDIASHFLTQIGDLITEKLAQLFIEQHGEPPCEFAWVSYGSQARRELLPSSDQDNGLLLAREISAEEDAYFARFSDYINQNLALCGQKLCPGNTMASNPDLRLSADSAIAESASWVQQPTPEAVMKICIFLDMRCIFGSETIFKKVAKARIAQVQNPLFLAALARSAQETRPPLTLFQRFEYDRTPNKHSAVEHSYRDGIDLKAGGINIINAIARLYAFAEGIETTGTLERLEQLSDSSGLVDADRHNLKDIWMLLQRLRWRHQLERGIYNSSVRASDLSSLEQHQLKAAFKAIKQAQEALLMKFSPGATL